MSQRTKVAAWGVAMIACAVGVAGDKERVPLYETPVYQPQESIPEKYRPLFFKSSLSIEEAEALRAQLPFDSVSLERKPRPWGGQAFKLTLFRSGKAQLIGPCSLTGPSLNCMMGRTPSERPRELGFHGDVDLDRYAKLCYLIEKSGFREMRDTYAGGWTDDYETVVTAVGREGTKAVTDYGSVGPVELWGIQLTMDALLESIGWAADSAEASPGK